MVKIFMKTCSTFVVLLLTNKHSAWSPTQWLKVCFQNCDMLWLFFIVPKIVCPNLFI